MSLFITLPLLLTPTLAAPDEDTLRDLILQLRQNDVAKRFEAAREINKLAAKDAAAVATLADYLGDADEYVRQTVSGALARIGKPALPALEKALAHRDALTRRTACLTLGQLGGDAKPALPAIVKALKDKERDVRAFAALALVRIEPEHPETFPALQQALKDTDRGIKLAAVYALEQLGTKRAAVLSAIVEALKDKEADVRIAAAAVLARAGPDAKNTVPALLACLKDQQPIVRVSVASTIAVLDRSRSGECVPVLRELLKAENADVRRGACYVLGQFGEAAGAALSDLRMLRNDPDPAVRQAAALALIRVGGK